MNFSFAVRFRGRQFDCVRTLRSTSCCWLQTVRVVGVGAAFDPTRYTARRDAAAKSEPAAREIALQILEASGRFAHDKKRLAEEAQVAERYRTFFSERMKSITVEPSGYDGKPAIYITAPRPYSLNYLVVSDLVRCAASEGLPPRTIVMPASDGTLAAVVP